VGKSDCSVSKHISIIRLQKSRRAMRNQMIASALTKIPLGYLSSIKHTHYHRDKIFRYRRELYWVAGSRLSVVKHAIFICISP
jgi:hypothetical protein